MANHPEQDQGDAVSRQPVVLEAHSLPPTDGAPYSCEMPVKNKGWHQCGVPAVRLVFGPFTRLLCQDHLDEVVECLDLEKVEP